MFAAVFPPGKGVGMEEVIREPVPSVLHLLVQKHPLPSRLLSAVLCRLSGFLLKSSFSRKERQELGGMERPFICLVPL